jgi:tRNA-2-methylthio-N6-dimethylallyladenosine synthase
VYDNNPTLEGIKAHDEAKQGSAFYKELSDLQPGGKRFYIESYGCQMNFSDSEIVASILGDIGYSATRNVEESDLILINTCSIREKAEDTVPSWGCWAVWQSA